MRKLGLIGGALGFFWFGCSEVRQGGDGEDGESNLPADPPPQVDPTPQMTTTDKVDLLFVVDNSISMADKQGVLAPSAVRLVRDLANPPCVDANGVRLPDDQQPASPAIDCPTGSTRSGTPVSDLRIGFISSSLGALTANNCASGTGDDKAHLLTRGPSGTTVPTYQSLGFLAFDPAQTMSPPGEADLAALEDKITDLVVGVDETGCGYEMPLEAMTRFLVDPAPYDSLTAGPDGFLVQNGVDAVLLQQRADFIRPDSLVSIVMLADENDCSMDVSAQGYLTLGGAPFYKSTSACEIDPNDQCCTSCALPVPVGCAPDPACGPDQGTAQAPRYASYEDHPNLRCWDQKRRYGIDFRYPIERYTNALSLPAIDPNVSSLAPAGGGIANPLFAGGRPASFVSFTAIVGVPWQDLATNPNDPESPNKTTSQMEADGTWSFIVEGGDPFMSESIGQRSGTNPATGASVSGPNAINGGDRTVYDNDDLQYACIFGLEEAEPSGPDCGDWCVQMSCDDPLCNGAEQIGAKAYPGVRQLSLVRSLGDRGIAGSICPSDLPVGAPPVQTTRVQGYDQPMLDLEAQIWQRITPKP